MDEMPERFEMSVPTYNGKWLRQPNCKLPEFELSGSHSRLSRRWRPNRSWDARRTRQPMPDIQIKRRRNGWMLFLHPVGGSDPSGYVFFLDDGRSLVVKQKSGRSHRQSKFQSTTLRRQRLMGLRSQPEIDMSDLDQLMISRILGNTVRPIHVQCSEFSATGTVGQMPTNRPIELAPLAPDESRDSIIVETFHKFMTVIPLIVPWQTRSWRLGLLNGASNSALRHRTPQFRRLLRLRKAGGFPVKTTREDKRILRPFLIPAELAFVKLTYRYHASYDDLLADPDVGKAFDENVAKVGRSGDVVAYRLAALHLRKNVWPRRKADVKQLAHLDISKVKAHWHTPAWEYFRMPTFLPQWGITSGPPARTRSRLILRPETCGACLFLVLSPKQLRRISQSSTGGRKPCRMTCIRLRCVPSSTRLSWKRFSLARAG